MSVPRFRLRLSRIQGDARSVCIHKLKHEIDQLPRPPAPAAVPRAVDLESTHTVNPIGTVGRSDGIVGLEGGREREQTLVSATALARGVVQL